MSTGAGEVPAPVGGAGKLASTLKMGARDEASWKHHPEDVIALGSGEAGVGELIESAGDQANSQAEDGCLEPADEGDWHSGG